jgi:biotin/methionine sulfoxide reductase
MTAEMLLNPGGQYEYNGKLRHIPDARLVWWAGGNPFHHAQDLNRLRQAFQRPETIVVNEINWTATARHADIVLPVAAPQERMDFGAGRSDNCLIPMPRCANPPGEASVEFDIYTALDRRLSDNDAFCEGLDADQWVRKLWAQTQAVAQSHGDTLPDWEDFIAGDIITLRDPAPRQILLGTYRSDPQRHRLPTPSGRIELYSEVIAGFGYADCPGQATWFEPRGSSDCSEEYFPLACSAALCLTVKDAALIGSAPKAKPTLAYGI